MHLDAFRIVENVNGYQVNILQKDNKIKSEAQLFFINLGGYKPNEFDEFHYKMIIAAPTKGAAIKIAKETAFYKHTGFKEAESHIDDKFGIDIDEIHEISDILTEKVKSKFKICLIKSEINKIDTINLGYFKWDKLDKL